MGNHTRTKAQFKGQQDAVVFSSGALVNLGIIPALTSYPLRNLMLSLDPTMADEFEATEIFVDALDHATILDGSYLAQVTCHLYKCRVTVFKHNDMAHLESRLRKSTTRHKLIIVDGVFSLHGHIARSIKSLLLPSNMTQRFMSMMLMALAAWASMAEAQRSYLGLSKTLIFIWAPFPKPWQVKGAS